MNLLPIRNTIKLVKLLSLTICLFSVQSIEAQEVNFADLVPEEGTRAKSFEDYLVQTAWMNNQKKRKIGTLKEVADERVKIARKQWLRSIQLNGSFSPRDELTLAQIPQELRQPGNIFEPGTLIPPFVNFGIGYSLGDLFTQKNEVRIAKKEAEVYEFDLNIERLTLRNLVLTAYQEYKSSVEIFNARKKAEDDAESTYYLISEKFRKDKASFEEYNDASIAYHNSVEKRLQAESEIQLARIDIEELIGTRWEKVERNMSRYSKRGKRSKKK